MMNWFRSSDAPSDSTNTNANDYTNLEQQRESPTTVPITRQSYDTASDPPTPPRLEQQPVAVTQQPTSIPPPSTTSVIAIKPEPVPPRSVSTWQRLTGTGAQPLKSSDLPPVPPPRNIVPLSVSSTQPSESTSTLVSSDNSAISSRHGNLPFRSILKATKTEQTLSANMEAQQSGSSATLIENDDLESAPSNAAATKHSKSLAKVPPKFEEDEEPESAPCGFKTRKRFNIFVCIILALVFAAILIPVIFFVVVPAVAQAFLNTAEFKFNSAELTRPTNTSFHLHVIGSVSNTGPISSTATFTGPVELLWNGSVVGEMIMPPLSISAGSMPFLELNLDVQVKDEDKFAESIRYIVWNSKFTWGMRGHVVAKALGIEIPNLMLEKEITLKGLDGLKSIDVLDFALPGNDPRGGIKLDIRAAIENPSPVAITMGDVNFDVFSGPTQIGEVTVPHLSIVPKRNELKMGGRLLSTKTPQDRQHLSDLFSNFVAGRESMITVVGKGVSREKISWLDKAINGLRITTSFASKKNTQFLKSLSLPTIDMRFYKSRPYSPLVSAQGVTAGIQVPFGDFPISITSLKMNIQLLSDRSEVMATMSSPWTIASGGTPSGKVTTSLNQVPLQVVPGFEKTFESFCRKVLYSEDNVNIRFLGSSDVVANAAIGEFSIKDVKVEDVLPFKGLQGMQNADIKVDRVVINRGSSKGLHITALVSITNPSNVHVRTFEDTMNFKIYYQGEYIAQAMPTNLDLPPGRSTFSVDALFEPANTGKGSAASRLAYQYATREQRIPITAAGHAETTGIGALQPALAGLRFNTAVPGLKESLVRKAVFGISVPDLLRKQAPAAFVIYNSFDVDIAIKKIYVDFFYQGTKLGFVDQTLAADKIIRLPPLKESQSPPVLANFFINLAGIQAIANAIIGKDKGFYVDVHCELEVEIGGFPLYLEMDEKNIFVKIGNPNAVISSN